MNFQTFEQQFETLLQEKAVKYPNAIDYLRHSLLSSVSSHLDTVLAHLMLQTNRDESYWANFEQVISDILFVMEMTPEELFSLEVPELPPGTNDFRTIQEELYETPFYPISEHLYYIDFEPALERIRFIEKQLRKLSFPGIQFCDLGVGPGVLMSLILKEKPSWKGHGIDISSQCAHYTERLLKIKGVDRRAQIEVGDVRCLPYADNTFDLIFAMEVLEHIPSPREGLKEAVRVLKPGGYAITSIPVRLSITMHLYVPSDPQEVLTLYEQANLKVLDFSQKEFQVGAGSFVDTFALSIKA